MGFNWMNPLRIFQGVLSLAVLISAAVFVTDDQDASGEGAFMIFVPLFTFIALAYLVGAPSFFPAIHNSWAALGIEALTWVLWLAGFAALAAMIPHYSCVSNGTKLCGSLNGARAATVLGAFVWLAFCVSLGYYVYQLIQARRGDASGNGIQGNTPTGPYDQAVSMEQQPHYPEQQPHYPEQQQYAPQQQQQQQQQQYPPQQQQYPPQQQYAPHQQQY